MLYTLARLVTLPLLIIGIGIELVGDLLGLAGIPLVILGTLLQLPDEYIVKRTRPSPQQSA